MGDDRIAWTKENGDQIITEKVQYTKNGVHDYCNNPADAWPIIVENMISVDQHANGSYARVWGYSESGIVETESLRSNILRAAMIVFIMMQENSK